MDNFWRAIKVTFKYKWNIIGVVASSLCLALCWGGNIATVYPLVQVSFQGDTVSTWLEKEVGGQRERIEKMRAERNALENDEKHENGNVDEATEKPQDATKIVQNAVNAETAENQPKNHAETYKNVSASLRRVELLNSQIETAEKTLVRYENALPYARRWTPNDPFMTVVWLMLFVLLGTLIKGVCTFAHSVLSSRIGQLGSYELRALFFRKMLGYEVNSFSARGVSDATSRFTSDMGALSGGLSLVYGKTIREPLKMIVCLVGAAFVSWPLLLFTFLFIPLAAVSIRWLAKSLKRVVRRAMIEMAELYGRIEETFRAIRVVKSFNREGYEIAKFRRSNKMYFKRGMKTAKYDAMTSPITECLGIMTLVLAILVGAYLVIYQKTTIFGIPMASRPLDLGSLILFYGFLIGASDPARRLSDIFTNIQSACAAADRVYEIIDRDVPIKDAPNPKRLAEYKDSIVFDGVFYEYPVETTTRRDPERKKFRFGDVLKNGLARWVSQKGHETNKKSQILSQTSKVETPNTVDASGPKGDVAKIGRENRLVLKNVSLEIKFGETIAIVGRSGCGKSTLLSMIPRFIDPTQGRVKIDGTPVPEIKIADVRDQIGLVSQDSVLFNTSVFENIRYGKPGASREEAIEAAKKAYADDFIRKELSDGYETVVGPGGGLLSGGQRQRIALARAFLKNPRILLLDEATSQIDLQSERYIHRALKNYIGGRTTILVTHRLTAIQLANRVVVMEDGCVRFVGTHEEALKNSAFYANLWATESLDEEL